MKSVILLFRTILDLLDFESVIEEQSHVTNRSRLTISGDFEEADIELARAGYGATIIDEHPG